MNSEEDTHTGSSCANWSCESGYGPDTSQPEKNCRTCVYLKDAKRALENRSMLPGIYGLRACAKSIMRSGVIGSRDFGQ